jgi:hypothetical protein
VMAKLPVTPPVVPHEASGDVVDRVTARRAFDAVNAMIAATDRKELVLQSGWVINYIAQQEALAAFQQEE